MDWSAQCMSSMTSTTGPVSARRSRTRSICSNSRARASPASSGPAGVPNSGSSRASSRAAAAGQQAGHPGRAEIAHELAEHGGEGGERQAVRAELQAAADQHPRPRAA